MKVTPFCFSPKIIYPQKSASIQVVSQAFFFVFRKQLLANVAREYKRMIIQCGVRQSQHNRFCIDVDGCKLRESQHQVALGTREIRFPALPVSPFMPVPRFSESARAVVHDSHERKRFSVGCRVLDNRAIIRIGVQVD